MKLRVIANRTDLENSGLAAKVIGLSRKVIWVGNTAIITPKCSFQKLRKLLSDQHISHGLARIPSAE